MAKNTSNNHLKLLLVLFFGFLNLNTKSQTIHEKMQTGKPIPVTFVSQKSVIRGLFYKASGAGQFPTVILCHGFPGGNTDVLGLGVSLVKEGINALSFNYRGTWGSEGLLTIPNSLEDVISAIHYIKSETAVRTFNIDTSNVTIIGYSYGGGMALLGSLSDTTIRRVVDIAGGDLSEVARTMQNNLDYKLSIEDLLEQGILSSGFKSLNAKEMFTDVFMDMDKYNLVKHSESLSSKDILLIGGWNDQANAIEYHLLPLFRALQKYGAKQLEIEIFSSDHSFKNVRDKLTQRIISWMKKDYLK
jgi:pimeloyl-ACP methyl ester carboxylesterase